VSNRREFITLLGGAAAAWPVGVWAQEPGRTYRIGGLHQSPRNVAHHNAFYAELERQGFIIGKNLAVDSDGYGLTVERFADHAQQLVNTRPDFILCGGDEAGRAAQKATTTIPTIVLADDMIRAGLITSLAKPGGNITGVSILARELDGKRQDLLLEAAPRSSTPSCPGGSKCDPPLRSCRPLQPLHMTEALSFRSSRCRAAKTLGLLSTH
jgi:putative tryptophan/tyrosine transport system substrate-binding protein